MNVYYKYITNRKKLKRYRNHRPIENNTVRLANLDRKQIDEHRKCKKQCSKTTKWTPVLVQLMPHGLLAIRR